MHRERISDDIYVFTSGLYAQVTAGAIITNAGAVMIDTLPFPEETRQVIEYVERRSPAGIRFVIYTHYHADHTYGGYLFKDAQIIAHSLCRDLLLERGEPGLRLARAQNPSLAEVELRLPDIVFTGEITLRLGGKTIILDHSPGHTPDLITAFVKEDKILFASDTVMPVPYVVDGDAASLARSLASLKGMGLENVVQGHGEVVLRGEIGETISSSVNYLQKMQAAVANALTLNQSRDDIIREYDIESCGKSRIALNGLVQQLHAANLIAAYDRITEQAAVEAEQSNAKARSATQKARRTAKSKSEQTTRQVAKKPAKKAAKKAASQKSRSKRGPVRPAKRSTPKRARRK
jgi:cyclase